MRIRSLSTCFSYVLFYKSARRTGVKRRVRRVRVFGALGERGFEIAQKRNLVETPLFETPTLRVHYYVNYIPYFT